ncbi:PilZ domain-containing protein [Sedimenticola sp.]|uniref:PilZ domain-containing protein n=1 Tax=Sedimenticola sp. TaxID=1940285 RepID=UPI003D0CD7DD
MNNRREHLRHPLTVDVKISHPDIGELIVKTKDISDGGLFILVEPADMPPIGEIVQGQVQGEAEDLPIVTMKIVRTEDDGLGLQFIED